MKVKFSSIRIGELFQSKGTLYVKTSVETGKMVSSFTATEVTFPSNAVCKI